ncbi:hypothetical protein GCM10023346_42680 [Arthrobacter gyeryongensis]|uniref:Uncharacterized protein n=1 Tax=Arthrobacter gyeryongensis TaxID=1650592 RepID=A0ABP9SPX8_9MICC
MDLSGGGVHRDDGPALARVNHEAILVCFGDARQSWAGAGRYKKVLPISGFFGGQVIFDLIMSDPSAMLWLWPGTGEHS